MTSAQRLLELTTEGPVLCVGLDPHPQVLEAFHCPDTPDGLGHWVETLLELVGVAGITVAKPQVALFERHGVRGMAHLAALMGALRNQGVFVVGDAKRGDIGSTMSAYATAWLSSGADFEVDALTLSPYLGVGSLEPALELARDEGKAVFVLAATSNPEATALQGTRGPDGHSVAWSVMDELARWWERSGQPPGIGCVIGATVDQVQSGLDLARHPQMPILAPGYGAQGASLLDARAHFPHTEHLVPVVARSVLGGGSERFLTHYQAALAELERS